MKIEMALICEEVRGYFETLRHWIDVADTKYDSSVLWLGDHWAWTLCIQAMFKFSVYDFRLYLECSPTKILYGTNHLGFHELTMKVDRLFG